MGLRRSSRCRRSRQPHLDPCGSTCCPQPYRHRLSILGAQRRAKIAVGCTAGVVVLVSVVSFVLAGLSSMFGGSEERSGFCPAIGQ